MSETISYVTFRYFLFLPQPSLYPHFNFSAQTERTASTRRKTNLTRECFCNQNPFTL